MFVYKKNTLQRKITADGTDRAIYTLTHTPTNVSISYEFQINNFNPEANLSMKEGRVAMTKPFVISKKRSDDSFEFYQESFDGNKTLLDNWKDAIGLFEGKIFEYLNETPSTPSAPDNTDNTPQDTFSELPQVGDIVKVNNRFGRVVDVNENTRDIKVEELTENEARDIIRVQRQAMSQENNRTDVKINTGDPEFDKVAQRGLDEFLKKSSDKANKLETGAILDDGFFTIRVDEEGSNVFIIRPTPPAPPSDETPPNPEEDQEKQPDNVIDLDPPQDDKGGANNDDEGDGGSPDDTQGDDEGQGNEGQDDGGTPDGTQGDDEGQGNEGQDDGGGSDDFGDDDEEDQDFGGAGTDDSEFEQALREAEELARAEEEEEANRLKQAKEDVKAVEQFLGKNASELKANLTLRQAQNLVGAELFPELSVQENLLRLNEALKLIFD